MKIITFGCRLNTFESRLIEQINADRDRLFVINTCAVTAEAERQCRQAIRKAHREHPDWQIVVTGCAAQLHPEIYAQMPEVSRVLGNREKLCPHTWQSADPICVDDVMKAPQTDLPLITDFEGRTRAFLQIQQGCDHACTFCIIHVARGKNIGLPPEKVIEQARLFVQKGFSEIVLTGVDITSYPYGFNDLIRRLIAETDGLKRLRFGSLDPACVDDELIDIITSSPVIMPHLHLSVQAGDNLVLKRMGRRHTREQVIRFCQKLRSANPDFVFGADLITGFPTETEAQFLNTCDLVQEADITQLHVFPYSVRSGTPAAKMPMVAPQIRKERAAVLRRIGDQLSERLLDRMIGTERTVLIEQNNQGYTDNYLKINVTGAQTGQIVTVNVTERRNHELVGQAQVRS